MLRKKVYLTWLIITKELLKNKRSRVFTRDHLFVHKERRERKLNSEINYPPVTALITIEIGLAPFNQVIGEVAAIAWSYHLKSPAESRVLP